MNYKAVLVVLLVGIAGTAWWMQKKSTTSQPTPTPTEQSPEASTPKIKYEKVLSVIKIPKGTQLPKVNLAKAIKLERPDMVLGYVLSENNNDKNDQKPLYECSASDENGSYSFLTSYKQCFGLSAKVKAVSFTLPQTPPNRFHIPMALCKTSKGVRYQTLSKMCEAEGDTVTEFLGWIYPAEIIEH